jgi:site-specific DNA recombinase
MRIAFYGRYSSDNQRDASIDDQRRVVARWAERNGHQLIAEFSDSAISGANIRLLPGLQQALQSIYAREAAFEAIAVDQLSRLSRDIGDTDAIVKRLRFFGVRLIAISDGLDTADETNKISVTVKSLVNEIFLDDLRKTTKRGLDGQFLKNYSTGGRTYGYRSEPVYDSARGIDPRGNPVAAGYRLTIVPAEAAVVQRVFRLFSDGHGEKAIARSLNATATAKIWRPNTIYLMLKNPRYIGRCIFNRREWRKNPETGKRVYRWRNPDQWETTDIEELRIIDHATWTKVQRRLSTRPQLFTKRRTATVHLLSGLLVCDECGGRYSIIARDYYGCRNRAELGTCTADLRIHRIALEQLVIDQLAKYLPEWIDSLRQASTRRAKPVSEPDAEGNSSNRSNLRNQAEAIMSAIEKGHLEGRALQEALARYQHLWDRISALDTTARPSEPSKIAEIRYDPAVLADFIRHLPEGLRSDLASGREFVHQALRSIRIKPAGRRPRQCPICHQLLGKPTPQHMAFMAKHFRTSIEAFRGWDSAKGPGSW